MIKLIILSVFLIGCATNTPTRYNEYVEIISGPHKGKRGTLVGDCSWFENYKVKVGKKYVCARSWEMRKVW